MPFELIDESVESTMAPHVVIIDDEFTSRAILKQVVQGIQDDIVVKTFPNPVDALDWIRDHQPDLILVDYVMHGMTGLDVVRSIRKISTLEGVPVVVITSLEDRQIRCQVLEAGATDFINKPIDLYECSTRCRNMLTLRLQHKIILNRSVYLERAVADATRNVRQRELETLFRLAKAGEYRDEGTGNHILRMAKYSRLIADGLGLEQERCEQIAIAAPMHDIGKIGIPDHILLKPGRLTAEELTIMKTHPLIGHQILQHSPSKYLSLGAEIALNHHEKYDGSGYPNGIGGNEIVLEARIVAVADVYDALTSQRPYKRAWSNTDALDYLTTNSGSHFDPQCVEAFVAQTSKATQIQQQLADSLELTLEPTSE